MRKKDCQAALRGKMMASRIYDCDYSLACPYFRSPVPISGLWELVAQGAQLYNIDLAHAGKEG